jgi:hypothetical protein
MTKASGWRVSGRGWVGERGVRQPARLAGEPATRSRLPVVPRRGKGVIPSLTPELQARLDEEEDVAKLEACPTGKR